MTAGTRLGTPRCCRCWPARPHCSAGLVEGEGRAALESRSTWTDIDHSIREASISGRAGCGSGRPQALFIRPYIYISSFLAKVSFWRKYTVAVKNRHRERYPRAKGLSSLAKVVFFTICTRTTRTTRDFNLHRALHTSRSTLKRVEETGEFAYEYSKVLAPGYTISPPIGQGTSKASSEPA